MITITKEKTITRDFLIVFLSSLLIAFIGRLEIPLPFTPVPVSFRAQLILFLSLSLGSRRAILATALFLAQGAIGFPVFAGGVTSLMGPNAGYIIGYLFGAFITGSIYEKTGKGVFAVLMGTLAIYACGFSVLSTYVGFSNAFLIGIAPFLLGDLAKSVVGFRIWNCLRRR